MDNKINLELALQQKVTPSQHAELNILHSIMDAVIARSNSPASTVTVKDALEMVEWLEFQMQQRWNFTLDARRHTHWYRLTSQRGE